MEAVFNEYTGGVGDLILLKFSEFLTLTGTGGGVGERTKLSV
jgi:hypothetical protein